MSLLQLSEIPAKTGLPIGCVEERIGLQSECVKRDIRNLMFKLPGQRASADAPRVPLCRVICIALQPHDAAGEVLCRDRDVQLALRNRHTESDAAFKSRDQRGDQCAIDRI